MKKLFAGTPHTKFIAAALAFTWLIAIATSASAAAELKEARVTQVVNDVKLLLERAAPRPAAVSDLVRQGSAVRTGTQSRSELTFADLTITRLGANTIFSFKEGTRDMNLIDGAILFQVPKGSGGATIRTVGVTAAITGTTGIGEFHPATANRPQPFSKWLCLEGKIRLYLPNGQSVELGPGKMVTTDGNSFSKVLDFDIAKLVSTSLFFTGFDEPLASMNLIMLESQNQLASGLLATTTNPLDPTTLVNVINQAIVAEEANQTPPSPPPPPPPTPSKFGTPSVISSPVPYLITSGTTISTDPAITTNGVTDYGKIYRGPTDDGAFSQWAFGSSSVVDSTLDFDTHFTNAGHFPAAVFKFTSLELAGNPTIDLSNGGVTNLGLISVGDITSGLPGGTLTFSGLDALLLASQDGSINLGSAITFQDIPTLFFYARGTNGDLTLASPILGTTDLFLYAGRNITFDAGTDLILGGDFSARTASGNVSVSESGDITVGGSLSASVNNNGGQIGTGGNISFTTGSDLTTGTGSAFTVQNTAGHIGTGGNIDIEIGGNLTAKSYVDVFLNNRGGGMIDSGGNLTVNIGGALNVGPGPVSGSRFVEFVVSNRYDDSAGNTTPPVIGSDVSLFMHAGSVNITLPTGPDTFFSAFISNRGGTIDGNASVSFNVSQDVSVLCEADIDILNDGGTNPAVQSPFGGTIHGDATLQVSAANFSADSLFGHVINRNGGVIDSNATLSFNLSGNLTTQGTALFQISNNQNEFSNGLTGGSIGSAATLTINAANVSVGTDITARILNQRGTSAPGPGAGFIGTDATLNITAGSFAVGGGFDASIFNQDAGVGSGTGGSIGGNAAINLNITSTLSSGGPATFQILNESDVAGSPGGTIVGNATINVSAGNIGDVTRHGDATFQILNNDGGHIGGDATVNVNAANITANSLLAQIDNSSGGTIGGSANVAVNIDNNVTTLNGITLQILNSNLGHIVTGADVLYSAGGTTSTTNLTEYIDNTNGGVIDNGGNVTLHTVGPVMLDGALGLEVDNFNGGTINNGANVTAHFVGNVTDTAGQFHSLNWYVLNGSGFFNTTATGGTIGTGGNINVTFDGNASTTGTSDTGSIAAEIQNGNGGSIGTGGNISMTVGGNLNAGPLFLITENQGGNIGTGGNNTLNVSGNITTQGDAQFQIFNNDNGNGPGTMGSNARINVSAVNISSTQGGAFFDIFNDNGGMIGGNATISLNIADVSLAGALVEVISNVGGDILGNAGINTTAGTVTLGTTDLNVGIANASGSIGGNASINFDATGDINQTNGNTFFQILNDQSGDVAASIGNDATVTVSGANILTSNQVYVAVENVGSSIGGNAIIDFTATGDITGNNTFFVIPNVGGTIGGDATINITAANITANPLQVQIDNTGGTIGGDAAINMNVSGSAAVTSDATFQILGSDGAASAAINFNGGSYDAGGMFRAFIDGNGAITFNNASVNADVLKAGVFGTNGVLNIGGGSLSADTTLNLYASGSNGQLNFLSNVTLGGTAAKILAANTVNIFNGVTVTIGGSTPADVYTNNANYTGFGGNGSRTGTFAGAGANSPQPLSSAPPLSAATVTSGSSVTRERRTGSTINVSSSDQLLSLLDGADRGPSGKITIPASSKIASNGRNSSRIDAAGRLNAGSRLNVDRRALDMRTMSSSVMRRSPQ